MDASCRSKCDSAPPLGGTYGALVLTSDDVDRDWQQALQLARKCSIRFRTMPVAATNGRAWGAPVPENVASGRVALRRPVEATVCVACDDQRCLRTVACAPVAAGR